VAQCSRGPAALWLLAGPRRGMLGKLIDRVRPRYLRCLACRWKTLWPFDRSGPYNKPMEPTSLTLAVRHVPVAPWARRRAAVAVLRSGRGLIGNPLCARKSGGRRELPQITQLLVFQFVASLAAYAAIAGGSSDHGWKASQDHSAFDPSAPSVVSPRWNHPPCTRSR